MDYYINNIQKNISTVNMFDAVCDKISNYKRNNIYTTEIHQILKIHANQCMYKKLNYKNVDTDAFKKIIDIISELCHNYHINYTILCQIFNMLGVYSNYDTPNTIDYILECILILNDEYKYELNYELFCDPEFELFLNFFSEMYNTTFDEKIDILIEYFYETDLRDSFLQKYSTALIEKTIKELYKNNMYHTRYYNHLIQHLSNMLLLDIVYLDDIYNFIFNQKYDMFPNSINYDEFKEYEFEYCQQHNINYDDHIIDYYINAPIQLK